MDSNPRRPLHPAHHTGLARHARRARHAQLAGVIAGLLLALGPSSVRAQQDALPRRSLFGAQLVPVPDTVRTRLNLAAGEGLALLSVTPGSTAAAAGLRVLDVLLAVDDTRVTSPQAGVTALRSIPVGRPVRFRFARAGRVDSVSTTMRERPRQQGENFRTHYDHVTVDGKRFRVMVTQPMRAGQPVAGAHPTLFVIGGIGPYSLDGPFESISYGDMLGAAVERGWATVRVDKAGQGDSEGGPTPEADFESELAMYRATMRALPRYSFVDTGRVFLFGHSMGGVFGPLLTVERSAGTPSLKGIAVYGTIAKSWPEYWVEAVRRQATLGALPLVTVDRIVREQAWLSHYLVMEGIEPADIRARHPELATALAAHVPDGRTISGLAFPFWRQLARRQLADAWSAYDGAVLSMHGESDFVGARGDHELIADIVNQAKPGRATFRSIPNSDHTFQQHATMPASLRAQGPAAINPAARLALFEWLDRLVASHKNRTGGADR